MLGAYINRPRPHPHPYSRHHPLSTILTALADRYAAYRFNHPPKPPTPAQIARRKLIFWVTWASIIALDAIYVSIWG